MRSGKVKKCAKTSYRLFLFLLTLLLIFETFAAVPLTASAETTKVQKSYDIAVVFDNSGSMYQNQAWCRAKYSMEIFASMLNYENNDKLRIFTMWGITTDGSKPTSGGSYSVDINNKNDIDKISKLYTVNPSNTPFAPITEAHNYLKSSKATDKWLIVLTDGEFNQIERGKNVGTLSGDDLKKRLISTATDGIKVQYLGFGGASELKPDVAKGFYAKKSSDTSLKDDLIGICNAIFQRSVLPSNRLSGNALNIDLSMKNLIVFAQGSSAKINSLVDQSGKEIKKTLDSGQRKYSDIKAKGYDNAPVDTQLVGQVVTFAECPKGKYTLNYSGADAIQIFYEPDVDIKVTLTNSDGEVVDGSSGEITAGDYAINSMIVDSKTGEDVTNHELMGNDVKLTTKVKQSDGTEKEYPNGSKITFAPDSSTDIEVVGTYLKDYTITSRDNPDLSWLKGLKISEPGVDFKIEASVLQPQSWFKISDHDNWKPIKVSMSIGGQPLSDEQLNAVKLSVNVPDDLKYRCEPVPGESAYYVYIAQDENGTYAEPKTGKYSLKASATYTDEYGKETHAEDDASFEIQTYSKFWRWLLWVLIIAIILIIIMMILNHPTLPSAVYLNIRKTSHRVKINGNSVGLSSDLYAGEIKCEAKACTPLRIRGKTTAAFDVKNIRPLGSVDWYEIDGSRFKKVNGKYVNEDNETIDKVKPSVRISDDTELRWKTNRHTITGRIYINHND